MNLVPKPSQEVTQSLNYLKIPHIQSQAPMTLTMILKAGQPQQTVHLALLLVQKQPMQ